jgi:hypothetical protein
MKQLASWNAWFQAYDAVYRQLPGDAHVPCPNCGQDALHTVFVGDAEEGSGYAFFWCGNCMFGIPLSRVPLPDGVPVLPRNMTPEKLATHVPDFKFVPDEG